MSNQKKYNGLMESINIKTLKKKQIKDLVKELGEREITLKNIHDGEKMSGFLDALKVSKTSLWEAMILNQFGTSIFESGASGTRAAEFLRDSAGEKPSTQVDLTTKTSPLDGMSTEEIQELLQILKESGKDGESI